MYTKYRKMTSQQLLDESTAQQWWVRSLLGKMTPEMEVIVLAVEASRCGLQLPIK